MPPVYCTTCVFYARLNTYSVRHRHHAYVRSTPLLFHRVFVHLLRYATYAVTLRTSDLDTGFFHTDIWDTPGCWRFTSTISPLFFIASPQTQVPVPSVPGPCADTTAPVPQPILDLL